MKIAFVSNSYGNGPLLETVLVMLVERHEVERIIPIGSARRDAEAVVFGRRRRFPEEVPWTDPGYEDYVLSAVLEGVVETPASEVERTEFLDMSLRPFDPREGAVDLGGHQIGVAIEGEPLPTTPYIVLASPGRHGIEVVDGRTYICPGQLREVMWDDEPAACALVALAEDQLYVGFLDLYGDLLHEAVPLGAH